MPAIPIIYAVFVLFMRFGRSTGRALRDEETRGLVFLTLALIAIGTLFYRAVEGLDWVDAFYFTVITLTTVGYGDISPETDAGKIFTVVYVLAGLGIIGSFVAIIASHARRQPGRDTEERDGADGV